MKLRITFLFSLCVCIAISSCAGNAAAVNSTETPTPIPATATVPLPTPTLTLTLTITPTPTPTQPAVDVNLTKVNNAVMVFENGTWVVKNADGAVTATWNGTEWEYNTENLKITRTIIGFDGKDASLLDPLLDTPLPEDAPETHFIDPRTGEPLPYGYVREDTMTTSWSDGNSYTIPFSLYAVRMVGAVRVDEMSSAVVLELSVGPDRSSIFVIYNEPGEGTSFSSVSDTELYKETLDSQTGIRLSAADNPEMYNAIRGQQVLMGLFHDIPNEFTAVSSLWDINDKCQAVQRYLKNPSAPVPHVGFNPFDLSPMFHFYVHVPAAVVDELKSK